MHWQIGDRAILIDPNGRVFGDNNLAVIGEECVLLGPPAYNRGSHDWSVGTCGSKFDVKNCNLRPIPDEYDGLEISSWSECPIEFHPDNFKVTV